MAAPRFFVPGPGVNPNIGSPAQYLRNISDMTQSRRRERIAANKLAQDKLFQDATLDLRERAQDFTEAAPQRAEELRLANLAREADKFKTVQDYAKGAQYVGGDRFTGIDDELRKDPRFSQLDEAGQLAARNEFILKNPAAITPPKQFAQALTEGLTNSGKFTGAEIEAYVAKEVAERYPTADKELIKSQLLKPKDLMSSGTNVNIGGKLFSGTGGGTGSFSTINDPTAPAQINQIIQDVAEERGLSNNPSFFLGQRIDFENVPGTSTDLTRQDLGDMASVIQRSGEISSPTAMRAAMIAAMTGEGNLKEGYDWRTKAGQEKLIAEAKKAQASEERLLNKKGGGISAAGQSAGSIFSPTNAANAATEYNQRLLSRLTPQALSDSGLAQAFLDTLGEAQTQPRQGDNGGGVITPEVVNPPVVTPAVEPVAQTPTPAAEFNIGGPVPEEVVRDNILGLLQDSVPRAPHQLLFDAGNAAINKGIPALQNFVESLTPPGPGVLAQTPQPTPQVQRPRADSVIQKAVAVNQARALERAGKIKPKSGSGRTREEALLEAYFEYLEGQRN